MPVLLKHDTHLLFLSSTEPLMGNFSSLLNNATTGMATKLTLWFLKLGIPVMHCDTQNAKHQV